MESSLIFTICYLQETSSETALCGKFENMDLLSPEQSIYSPDNGSGSENSGSSESTSFSPEAKTPKLGFRTMTGSEKI